MNAYERLIVQALREAASYSRIAARKKEYLATARELERENLNIVTKAQMLECAALKASGR